MCGAHGIVDGSRSATSFVKPYDELQPLVAIGYDESLHGVHECERKCSLHLRYAFGFRVTYAPFRPKRGAFMMQAEWRVAMRIFKAC